MSCSLIRLHPSVHHEHLRAEITIDHLGFRPERIWNPSPSVRHRTAPYPLPHTAVIGMAGNAETGAKFSPPPFAVALEGRGRKALVAVAARAGWHRWNEAVFQADSRRVQVLLDLEGHARPDEAQPHVTVAVLPGEPGESNLALLSRGLARLYPAASRPRSSPEPAWWRRPIYCGWGDQVSISQWLEGAGPEPRALAYCTQGLYERWIRRLEHTRVPIGTVTIDAGWSPAGVWEPDSERWPDLRGFIRRQHEAGRRVLLWLAAWLWDGLPDDWCLFAGKTKLTADPTHPAYRAALRARVRELLAPDGYDADGFKIDQLAFCPSERRPRGGARFGLAGERPGSHPRLSEPAGRTWGCELLYRLQKDIAEAARAAKPDALLTSSTVHPYFHDTFDMVRLHDMGLVAPDIFAAMGARASLARAALPGKPIDTDDWIHSDYAMWRHYTAGSSAIGVPCIFYAERFMADWRREPATRLIPAADLRRIGDAWRRAGLGREA